jgi:Asp-tRNA(Asn)/Glu-tRNA(Gln) amidotransferase A subunit family amidase
MCVVALRTSHDGVRTAGVRYTGENDLPERAVSDLPMSAETLQAAELVAGVAYTDAERALMLDNIATQIDLAKQRRRVRLPLALPPATRFDPRPPGFALPPAEPFRPDASAPPPIPDDAESIAFAPVAVLGKWLRAGAISSVRLTRIYLDRIERLAPMLECFVTVTADLALAQAARADKALADGIDPGPLAGIPWGCKDIIDTAGIVTGWGAEPWRNSVPDADATVVRLLAEAGAVLLGKLAVGALAYGDIWYGGRTRNPWNLAEGSSGSSAGSASATAAGLVGFSLGTETLGSIVAPSLRCGTTGLRPTFGRVSRTGTMPLCWTLDKIGPICRSVEDTALVLQAINAPDPRDVCQIAAPFGYDAGAPVAGLRVGYVEADVTGDGTIDLDRAVLEVARGLGVELVPLRRGDLPYVTLTSILDAEAAASFEELTLSDQDDLLSWQDARAWPNAFRKARFLSAVDHVQLDRLRRMVMQEMAATFREVDAIIGPPLAGPMLVISNFTGHPCLILRSGFRQSQTRVFGPNVLPGASHTVPHAVCLWGRLFEEGTILRLGRALEGALGVLDRRPVLESAI